MQLNNLCMLLLPPAWTSATVFLHGLPMNQISCLTSLQNIVAKIVTWTTPWDHITCFKRTAWLPITSKNYFQNSHLYLLFSYWGSQSFASAPPLLWNDLPEHITISPSISTFQSPWKLSLIVFNLFLTFCVLVCQCAMSIFWWILAHFKCPPPSSLP